MSKWYDFVQTQNYYFSKLVGGNSICPVWKYTTRKHNETLRKS